ncbi:hypothetical protein ACLOJK_009015 [Asimina triloba]
MAKTVIASLFSLAHPHPLFACLLARMHSLSLSLYPSPSKTQPKPSASTLTREQKKKVLNLTLSTYAHPNPIPQPGRVVGQSKYNHNLKVICVSESCVCILLLISSLAWLQPKKALSINLGELQVSITSVLGEGADGVSVSLVLAAVTGLGLLAYAEDRKQTIRQLDEFLTTKVAPGELVDEIKAHTALIGKALLPAPFEQKALPGVTAEGNPSTDIPEATKVGAAAAPPPVNSVQTQNIQISNPQHLPLLQSLEQCSNTTPHVIHGPWTCISTGISQARQKKNPKTLHEVLSSMPTRDVVSWTAMILGYSKCEIGSFGYREDNSWTSHRQGELRMHHHGLELKAITLFQDMLEKGIKQNAVTFVGLLTVFCEKLNSSSMECQRKLMVWSGELPSVLAGSWWTWKWGRGWQTRCIAWNLTDSYVKLYAGLERWKEVIRV